LPCSAPHHSQRRVAVAILGADGHYDALAVRVARMTRSAAEKRSQARHLAQYLW